MAHHKKKHGPAPIPPKNKSKTGPPAESSRSRQGNRATGSPFPDQDAKRRLGDFEGAGEHSRQQPTALNDGLQHSR